MLGALLLALTSFVRVQGGDFVLDQKPFRFVGANLRVMQGDKWRASYEDLMAAAARDGITVGRIWALGEGELDAAEWQRKQDLFRAGPTGWIEGAYLHLDRVLVAARRHNIRLIITLANQWGDYGGAPQYLRWLGITDYKSIFGTIDRFYSEARVRALYAAHVERLLSRRNSIDGTPYLSDPTILAWEIINESYVEAKASSAARRDFIAWASAFIKARDPNHLVSAGMLGYETARMRDDWIAVHELPTIDYCDAHLYPKSTLRVQRLEDIDERIDDFAQLARHVIGKPLVIGEFGFPTLAPAFRGTPTLAWYERLLLRVRHDGVAGALVWIYQANTGLNDEYPVFFDDDRSAPLRALLAREAAAMARAVLKPDPMNPRLSKAHGRAPLIDLRVRLRPPPAPSGQWRRAPGGTGLDLLLPAQAFSQADWEVAGTWDEGEIVHAYGREAGFFEYVFSAPPETRAPPSAIEIRIRLSSEFPGGLAPVEGASRMFVSLDGKTVAETLAFPDDGLGRFYTLRIEDRESLARAARPGSHALRFTVPEGAQANGLCIYGEATKRSGPAAADAAPIRLRWIK